MCSAGGAMRRIACSDFVLHGPSASLWAAILVLGVVLLACGVAPTTVTLVERDERGSHCAGQLTRWGGSLFWVDSCAREIARLDVDGGARAPVVSGVVSVDGLAVDDQHMYWLARGTL